MLSIATYFGELRNGLWQNGEELALVGQLARLNAVHCLHASDHRVVKVLQLVTTNQQRDASCHNHLLSPVRADQKGTRGLEKFSRTLNIHMHVQSADYSLKRRMKLQHNVALPRNKNYKFPSYEALRRGTCPRVLTIVFSAYFVATQSL